MKPLSPDDFASRVRSYQATVESDAAIPRRPARLRDDDRWCSGSERDTDSEFFRDNPGRRFRLLSASGGDEGRAGIAPLPGGKRAVRLSRRFALRTDRDGVSHHSAVIFTIDNTPDSAAGLNAMDEGVLQQLWWVALGAGRPQFATSPALHRAAENDGGEA